MSKSDLEMISQRVYCSCFGHNHLRHERSPSGTSWYSIPIFLTKTLGWSIGGKTASDWASSHRRCQYSNRPGTWRNKPPWRILFFGTDDFSLHTLQALSNSRTRLVDTLEVVTKKKSPIEAYAQRNGLLTYHWPVPVTAGRFDVGVLVSFGKLIPQNVIKMFPYGIVNIHPSLLPRWRGSAPIPYTILNGDTETGISIMHIRPSHFDQGPVILQETCPVSPHCTSLQLAKILAAKGGNLILEVLCNLPQHLEQAKAQSPNGATLASKLHPAMGYVDWAGQTCQQIHQQYRAFHELFPLRTEWCGSKVKLLHLVTSNAGIERGAACHLNTTTFHPGQPYYHKQSNTLYIRCQDGWVGFQRIVLRKPLTARDFDCGYLSKTPPNAAVFTSVQNGLFLTDDNNR